MSDKKDNTVKTFTRARTAEWLFVNLPYVFFICALIVVYIYGRHGTERSFRKITDLKKQVDSLKWQAVDIEKEVMYDRTQSELTRKLEDKGLKPLTKVPIKIKGEEK
jgi:hypothetical protein